MSTETKVQRTARDLQFLVGRKGSFQRQKENRSTECGVFGCPHESRDFSYIVLDKNSLGDYALPSYNSLGLDEELR
jgi:hypothetical protein